MISILLPLVPFDEKRAINRVTVWVALAHHRLSKEWSREWLEVTLRQYLRGGLITVIKVIDAADKGDEIADAALREVGAELIGLPLEGPGDLQILAYFQRAGLRAPHKRGRGRKWYDRWSRDLAICLLIQLACKEFGVAPTRNSASVKKPSGCSLVAAALKRNRIRLDERSVQQHIWLGLPGELARQAFAERPVETYFSVSQ